MTKKVHSKDNTPIEESDEALLETDDEAVYAQDSQTAEEDSQDECAKLKSELASVKDSMLRRQADFDNYKKRMVRLLEDNRKYAVKDIAFDIVQINDDLLRAIEASKAFKSEDRAAQDAHDSFVQGVTMISKNIESVLEKYSVTEIEALNHEFDPNLHEAVEIDISPDVVVDTVTQVHRKGFIINDMVLRSAQVKVTKPEKKEGE